MNDYSVAADYGVPLTFEKNQVLSSQDGYLITIPPNARPGETFPVVIEGRQLMVLCPRDKSPGDQLRVAPNIRLNVRLPTGALGVYWKGKKRAKVSRLDPFSPLNETLKEGMKVDSLDVPGDGVYRKLNAARLGELLEQSSHVENRKLVVIKKGVDE